MSSSPPSALHDDRPMTNTSPGPRAEGPKSRQTFTPAQKLDLLAGRNLGEKIGRLTPEQAEIARLPGGSRSRSDAWESRRSPLGIVGKHTNSWNRSPRVRTTTTPRPRVADGHLPGSAWINRPVEVPAVVEGDPQLAA